LRVLANVSANFSMVERLQGLGFRDVVPFPEREPVALGAAVRVTRYPTAGIDNMLHVAGSSLSVLNYNDCNLPAAGVRAMRNAMGPIDVLLTSYNHAGKLFSRSTPEREKRAWYGKLARLADLFEARHVIPFASTHYYRSPFAADQNASLLSFDDLETYTAGDTRFCILRPGDRAEFPPGSGRPVIVRQPANTANALELHDYGASVPLPELLRTCSARCEQLQRNFGSLVRLVQPLRVWAHDLSLGVELCLRRGARALAAEAAPPHIELHSKALFDWLGRRFGDDTFFAGAHFAIRDPDTTLIERWALLTLLEASHLDPRSVLGYLRSRRGLSFLWARREEILASLTPLRFKAAQLRL
jgi:hypothetical protein